MSWRWVALLDPHEAVAGTVGASRVVPVRDAGGGDAGVLAFWPPDAERRGGALRIDERVEGTGPATWVSWCRSRGDTSYPFDDAMVMGALRRCLAARWPSFVSTLLVDWSRIAGAMTGGVDARAVAADPFARIFPRRMLRVEAGNLGVIPAPTGPGVVRYGSGNPWPWDRYAGQVE